MNRLAFHPFPTDKANAIAKARRYAAQDPLFLDTETTGIKNIDEICEIAIIDLAGNVLINSLVKPTKPIPDVATEIHGITNDMVKDAPTFRDLLPQLQELLTGRTVLVYNVEFDEGMIEQSLRVNGFQVGAGEEVFEPWWNHYEVEPGKVATRWHCVMELYAAFYGDFNDYHRSYRWQRLSHAAWQCDIDVPKDIHRAHADAELTRRILLHMTKAQHPADDDTGAVASLPAELNPTMEEQDHDE